MTREWLGSVADFWWQVLDFGAARDGVPASERGRRIVVDARGREIEDVDTMMAEHEAATAAAAGG